MNKADLVDILAHEVGTTKKEAEMVVNAFMDTVVRQVARGEKVTLVGFGTFDASQRSARTGRNPKTNEPLDIPAKRVARFKAGKDFAVAVDKKAKQHQSISISQNQGCDFGSKLRLLGACLTGNTAHGACFYNSQFF